MEILNIHWLWTYENLSQIDVASEWYGSYNNITELQVSFYIWNMKLLISIPKVVVKIILDNA